MDAEKAGLLGIGHIIAPSGSVERSGSFRLVTTGGGIPARVRSGSGNLLRGLPGAAFRGLLLVWLAGAMGTTGAAQTSPKSKASAPAAEVQTVEPGSAQSGYVLKVKTRLVTLDVLATDADGKAVRDLKPEDFQSSRVTPDDRSLSSWTPGQPPALRRRFRTRPRSISNQTVRAPRRSAGGAAFGALDTEVTANQAQAPADDPAARTLPPVVRSGRFSAGSALCGVAELRAIRRCCGGVD
jgi:hypothetical protein